MGSQSHHSFVYLEGSLVKEPEIIHFSNGSLAKFTLRRNFLVPSYNKDEKGTWKDEFFDVKKNLKTGETLKLKKWSKVVVSGELCQECWEDNETKKKRSRVIIKAKTITVSADEPDNVHDQNVQNLTQTFAPQQQYQQGPPQQQQQPIQQNNQAPPNQYQQNQQPPPAQNQQNYQQPPQDQQQSNPTGNPPY